MTRQNIKKEFLSWIFTAICVLPIYIILSMFIFTAKVNGISMDPNLKNNDSLLVNKIAYQKNTPKYGDIIVFYSENKNADLIKRVIGLPNDKIEIKDGFIYRNGTKLDESSYNIGITDGNIDEIVLPEHVFVLGDNRSQSADSRYPQIGQIKFSDIKGKAIFRFFPNTTVFK